MRRLAVACAVAGFLIAASCAKKTLTLVVDDAPKLYGLPLAVRDIDLVCAFDKFQPPSKDNPPMMSCMTMAQFREYLNSVKANP